MIDRLTEICPGLSITQVGIDNSEHDHKAKYINKTMGASTVAALLGFSPFKTPVDVCNSYILEHSAFNPSVASELGHLLEEYIFDKACQILPERYPHLFLGEEVEFIYPKDYEYTNSKFDYLTTNFDGVVYFPNKNIIVPLEIKRSNNYHVSENFGPTNDYLYCQTHVQMFELGDIVTTPFAFTVQMDRDNDITTRIIYRNDDFIEEMLKKVELFFKSEYNIEENYMYFEKEEVPFVTDKEYQELDKLLFAEFLSKKQYESSADASNKFLKTIKNNNYSTNYYKQTEKEIVEYTINNPVELIKELEENLDIDSVRDVSINKYNHVVYKLNITEIKNKVPKIYDKYISEQTTKIKSGKRDGKKLKEVATTAGLI